MENDSIKDVALVFNFISNYTPVRSPAECTTDTSNSLIETSSRNFDSISTRYIYPIEYGNILTLNLFSKLIISLDELPKKICNLYFWKLKQSLNLYSNLIFQLSGTTYEEQQKKNFEQQTMSLGKLVEKICYRQWDGQYTLSRETTEHLNATELHF